MGSDVQWQQENGYGREVEGDFSSSIYDTTNTNERNYQDYFYHFSAASLLAKAFPGATLTVSGKKAVRAGVVKNMYLVDVGMSPSFEETRNASWEVFDAFRQKYKEKLAEARALEWT